MNRKQQARSLKIEGLTYQQIGDRLGVSRQRAQQLVSIPKDELRTMRLKAGFKCSTCGRQSNKLDGHHEDYNNDDVVLLCVSCHMVKHFGDGFIKSRLDHCKKFKPLSIRPGSGEFNEQIERLCESWNVDASKAIRRAVAEADERLQMDSVKEKSK